MSSEHDTSAHPRSEDDHIDSKAVLLVGFGSLVVFTLAGLAAVGYLRVREAERPPPPLPAEIGSTKIALVEQQLFESGPLRGDRVRSAQLARLHGAGWVDRAAAVAHIPIEDAMALVATGQRAAPSQPPTAPPLGAVHGGVDAPSVAIAAAPAAPGGAAPAPAAKAPPAAKATRPAAGGAGK
jgi:hypothetical protein